MFRHGVAFVGNARVIHRLPVVRHLYARQEKAAGATGEHQCGDLRGIAAGAPGIGPSTAEKILQTRKSYGPFKSVDDFAADSRAWAEGP